MRPRIHHSVTPHADMIRTIVLTLAVVVASHVCLATPMPDPDPVHKTHIKIHVPYEIHTMHHHHIEKVPVIKEVPIIKEVPVVKTVPVVQTVHVPVVKTIPVEKHVFVPVPYKEHMTISHHHWD